MDVLLDNKRVFSCSGNGDDVMSTISHLFGLSDSDYYCTANGKRMDLKALDSHNQPQLHIVLRLRGGKGGFGSMLRAIGAQIEKTTNREACRDLSGRRLRDINEEERLKKWISQEVEREKEAIKKRKRKLEKLTEEPSKLDFHDESYNKERERLPDLVQCAVDEGYKASSSRPDTSTTIETKKKPKKLWMDDMDSLSSDSDESQEVTTSLKHKKSPIKEQTEEPAVKKLKISAETNK